MKLLFLVNDARALKPGQTTTALIAAAAARGSQVFVAGVGDLSLTPQDRVLAHALPATATTPEALVRALAVASPTPVWADGVEGLLLRTNPARDQGRSWAHRVALDLARLARERGVTVLSDPDGLARAGSKLYLSTLPPRYRPTTLVSQDVAQLRAFVESAAGPCVLKPLEGTHGRDVFFVDAAEPRNLNQILHVLTRQGYAMAQSYVPEAAQGDTRVLLLEGKLLEVDGRAAIVRRVPGGKDFRSNVSAGGHAAGAELTPFMRELCETVGPRLLRDGIFLAGLDLIGEKVVEINVFSPGGLGDAGGFAERDFLSPVLEAIARRAREASPTHPPPH